MIFALEGNNHEITCAFHLHVFMSFHWLQKTPQEYSTHGISLILMDSKWNRRCGSLGLEAHDKMANWIIQDDGTKSDPSHKARGTSWKSGKGISKDVVEQECSISSLEFIDSSNNSNVIERICIHDKGILLIKCTSTDDQATIKLRNELVGLLDSKGFKHVE